MAETFTHTWLDPVDVAAWLRLNSAGDVEGEELERVCVQTEAYVQRCRPEWYDTTTPSDPAPDPAPLYAPDGETYQGAVMYAARQYRRRNSPAGTEMYGDGDISFVSRYDADIDRALRTGLWNRPGVG